MTEPAIDIEGTRLTFSQAMALRVAASDFLMQMDDPEYANAVGEKLAEGYRDRIREVLKLMTGKHQ